MLETGFSWDPSLPLTQHSENQEHATVSFTPTIPYQMQIFLWNRLLDTRVTSATWRAAKAMTTGTSTTADRARQSTVLSPFFRAFSFHSLDSFVTVTILAIAVRGEKQSTSKTVTCLWFLRA